jgi:hypothetical protein
MTEPSETHQSPDGGAPTVGNFFSPVLLPCSSPLLFGDAVMEMQMLDGRCLVAYLWLCHTVITRRCIMEMCLILMYLISSLPSLFQMKTLMIRLLKSFKSFKMLKDSLGKTLLKGSAKILILIQV